MSRRNWRFWTYDIMIALVPPFLRVVVPWLFGRDELGHIVREVLGSAEASMFAMILILITLAHITEKYSGQNRPDVNTLRIWLIWQLIALLVAIACNLVFNVSNSTVSTCWTGDAITSCPLIIRTTVTESSINIWWCLFNIGTGIMSVLSCSGARNQLASTAGHSEEEK